MNQKTELESQTKSLKEIKESLTEELNSIHDLLNEERVLAAKHQVETTWWFQRWLCFKNETRRLENELLVAQSTNETLKQVDEQLEKEQSDLKIEIKNEKSKTRDLEKRYKEAKDKLESFKKETEKRENEKTSEFKTKLTTLQNELKVCLLT